MRLFAVSVLGAIASFLLAGVFYFAREYYLTASKDTAVILSANLATIKSREIRQFIQSDKKQKEITLLFVGDIMLSRAVGAKIKNQDDPRFPFLKIADEIKSADLAFGNLESPISEKGKNQGSIYSFRADPGVAAGLKFAGFDVLSLANNHIFDWGSIALVDTVEILKNSGIDSVGAGKDEFNANAPLVKQVGDTKIAFLAFTNLYPKSLEADADKPGISHFDIPGIKKAISELKKSNDIVVVSLHWGEEYKINSNDVQKDLARALVEVGADLIVGHHPHVVQEIERSQNSWIAYSLGNFVFDQSFSKETMEGLILKVKIKNKKVFEVEPVKIKINSDFQPFIE